MKDFCDVIVARSTVEDAMKKLGKSNVSEWYIISRLI